MAAARQERKNQLIGSNQRQTLLLVQAYKDQIEDDPLLSNDNPYLVNLAKNIAVIRHW